MNPSIERSPVRTVMLAGAPWTLESDTRAWYNLELLTGQGYASCVYWFLNSPGRIQPLLLLLWCFTATYRKQNNIAWSVSKEERDEGQLVPSEFVALVLFGFRGDLAGVVTDMLVEGGQAKREENPEKKTRPRKQRRSTGPADSGTQPDP